MFVHTLDVLSLSPKPKTTPNPPLVACVFFCLLVPDPGLTPFKSLGVEGFVAESGSCIQIIEASGLGFRDTAKELDTVGLHPCAVLSGLKFVNCSGFRYDATIWCDRRFGW